MSQHWFRIWVGILSFSPLAMAVPASSAPQAATPPRATIEIVGHGSATAAPEYARLNVNITSICFETAAAARDANAVLANNVLEILKRYRRGPKDRVTATGNSSSLNTEYSGQQVLCTRKWRSDNLLVLETSALDVLGELQAEVIRVIDAAAPPGQPQKTSGTVSQFSFHIYPEMTSRLRLEAQNRALQDARAQFQGFATACGFRNHFLKHITPPVHGMPTPPHAHEAPQPGGVKPPLIPSELKVDVAWKFVWEFEHNGSCLF